MSLRTFALTYPQLMSQALAQGVDQADLARLRQAYELAERMADGLYRAQGEPFICHLVRTASIVLAERQPIEVVMASLLHSAYKLHCFEGGSRSKFTGALHRTLRRELPPEAETLINEYDRLPWSSKESIERHAESADTYPEATRRLLVIRLANEFEDYLDSGMADRGRYPYREQIAAYGGALVTLAKRLGLTMADELREVFDRHLAMTLPDVVTRQRRGAYELPSRRWGQMGRIERWYRMSKRWIKQSVRARTEPAVCCEPKGRDRNARAR